MKATRRVRDRSAVAFGLVFIVVGLGVFWGGVGAPLLRSVRAQGWTEARCTIDLARTIETRSSDGDPMFALEVAYRYVAGGVERRGTRLDWHRVRTSSRDTHAARAARYAVATSHTCWYDPASPDEVVVDRRGWIGGLGSLVLVFVVAGIAVLGLGLPARARRRVREDGWISLRARGTRWLRWSAAAGHAALVLACIAGAFATETDSGVAIWVIAVIVVAWFAYETVRLAAVAEIAIERVEVALGERVGVAWSLRSPVRLGSRRAVLRCVEHTVRGTGEDASAIDAERLSRPLSGRELRVPRDGVASFEAGDHAVRWELAVRGNLVWWLPGVAIAFPLEVVGARARRPTEPAPLPAVVGDPLELRLAAPRVVCGDAVVGVVAWRRDAAPRGGRIELTAVASADDAATHATSVATLELASLPRWAAAGTGDALYRDSSSSASDALAAADCRTFQITAPRAPLTCDGELVRVQWFVRAFVDDETIEVEIAIASARE